jgi:hypothetical protein
MSGPNPPGPDSPGPDYTERDPGSQPAHDATGETDAYSQAYSAPESEQFTSGPYVPVDPGLYDYDSNDPSTELIDQPSPPRWPWVVGVAAIVAAVALVVSVSLLVTSTNTSNLATRGPGTTTASPPSADEVATPPPPPPATTEEPPPPPPTETVTVTSEPPPTTTTTTEAPPSVTTTTTVPPVTTTTTTTTTTPAGPRQVTYSVTGTKAPFDIITVTYVDASGRSRVQRNVYIPWSLTVTPISQSEVGSVQASSLFSSSRLNCQITTSDGQVLSSNTNNAPETSC